MKTLSRLVRFWALSKTFTRSTPIYMSLLSAMALVTVGAILFTVMVTLMAIGASWLAYTQLLAHGLAPAEAMAMIGVAYLSLMVIAALVVRHYWLKVAKLAQKFSQMQSPLSGVLGGISDAFLAGFNNPRKP